MVGHLSDGFMKFKNDEEEIMKEELALALKEMWTLGRYDELLFIMDSCQSFTLCDNFDKVDKIRGLDITIVTSSKSKKGTLEMLKEFNFPINDKKN